MSEKQKIFGFCLKYSDAIESLVIPDKTFALGLFTRHTQTFFEPFIETQYDDYVEDERVNFYLGKENRLYFYSVINGKLENLDDLPTCTINGTGYTVNQQTKGTYYVTVDGNEDLFISYNEYNDVWGNIMYKGKQRPDVTLRFVPNDADKYYNFNVDALDDTRYGLSLSGIKVGEKLLQGEKRKVNVLLRKPYTISEYFIGNSVYYQLYVKQGPAVIKITDWQKVNKSFTNNYFTIDTTWLVPQRYFVDIKVETNGDEASKKNNTSKKAVSAITDKNILDKLNFEYQYPGDNTYVYDFLPSTTVTEQSTEVKGTWYAKNKKTGKIFQISGNYPSTEKNLDKQFPQAKNPVNKSPEPNTGQTNTGSTTSNSATSTVQESLKKNLKLIKENKDNLLVEKNIVKKRFSFIMEGSIVETEEDRDKIVESVISEIGYLKNQGYSSQAINEGLFSFLGSMIGGTAGATPNVFKEYLAGWLLKKLGVPEDSYMGSVVVTLVGDMGLNEYDKFFSDCRFASNKLADALIEGYLYQVQKEKGLNSSVSGFLVSAVRNAVSEYLLDDKDSLVQKLENQLSEFLCPVLSKLFGVITDKADDLKSKVVA